MGDLRFWPLCEWVRASEVDHFWGGLLIAGRSFPHHCDSRRSLALPSQWKAGMEPSADL